MRFRGDKSVQFEHQLDAPTPRRLMLVLALARSIGEVEIAAIKLAKLVLPSQRCWAPPPSPFAVLSAYCVLKPQKARTVTGWSEISSLGSGMFLARGELTCSGLDCGGRCVASCCVAVKMTPPCFAGVS